LKDSNNKKFSNVAMTGGGMLHQKKPSTIIKNRT